MIVFNIFTASDAEAIRGAVRSVLQTTQPLKNNLTNEERNALKTLRDDKRGSFLKADKSNAVV